MRWIVSAPEHGDSGGLRHGFLDQLHALRHDDLGKRREPSDVPSGSGEAFDKSSGHQVSPTDRHDNWDGSGRLLGGTNRVRARCDDGVDLEPDQVSGEARKPIGFPVGIAHLNDDVLSVRITELAEAIPKRLDPLRSQRETEQGDARSLCCRLCPGRERRSERSGQRDHQGAAAVHHSMI